VQHNTTTLVILWPMTSIADNDFNMDPN